MRQILKKNATKMLSPDGRFLANMHEIQFPLGLRLLRFPDPVACGEGWHRSFLNFTVKKL